jgi:hypothetical protein
MDGIRGSEVYERSIGGHHGSKVGENFGKEA